MKKALEKIKEMIDFCDAVGCHRAIYESIKFVEAELEALKPTHEAVIKAKDEEIERLNNLYADTIKDLGDALIELDRTKEKIEELDKLGSEMFMIDLLHGKDYKARSIVAMLFWKARRQKKVFLMYYEEYGKNNSLTQCYRGMYEQAIMDFSKAYKMLRGKKCRGY